MIVLYEMIFDSQLFESRPVVRLHKKSAVVAKHLRPYFKHPGKGSLHPLQHSFCSCRRHVQTKLVSDPPAPQIPAANARGSHSICRNSRDILRRVLHPPTSCCCDTSQSFVATLLPAESAASSPIPVPSSRKTAHSAGRV